ncbi:MAG: aminotransferase class III-fold pyridoxal phosphate-dependent enzyme [Chloroflexi bacterium]|nr:aminotransferase class III-fold pyridoxal phosphate-dependent enzyme [Chloroflexota bacterium]
MGESSTEIRDRHAKSQRARNLIDYSAGESQSFLEACVAGHIRPELADAAYEQMQRLEFFDVFRYASPPAIELAARLAEITSGSLQRVHFTPGGSEAVETAIKIAKQYHMIVRGDKKRYKVITREGAYHGCTFGAMAVDGEYFGTQIHFYDPLPPFGRTSPPPYHYRCQHCANEDACNLTCIEDIEQVILREDPETIAAIAPPLTMGEEEIEHMIGIVDQALTIYEERYL